MAQQKLGRKDYSIAVKTGTDANKTKFAKECVQGEPYFATDTGSLYLANSTAGASDGLLTQISSFSDTVSESTTARTLSNSDNGKVIVCSNSSQIIVTLPSGLTSGFGCTVVQSGAGVVLIEGSGGTIVYGFGNKTATAGQYASINIYNAGTDTYALEGDTQLPPFVNTYSLELNGTNQYLSFASAISTQVYAMSVWFKPDVTITTSSNVMTLLSGSSANHLTLGGNISGGLTENLFLYSLLVHGITEFLQVL